MKRVIPSSVHVALLIVFLALTGASVALAAEEQSKQDQPPKGGPQLVVEVLGKDQRSKTEALALWADLQVNHPQLIALSRPRIQPIDLNSGKMAYRLLLVGIIDEQKGAELCRKLKSLKAIPECNVVVRVIEPETMPKDNYHQP
jgi:hypothetical protein